MSRQATRNTVPEVDLRRELHHRGLRFRVSRRPLQGFRSTADIVFTRAKVAVYVDGCFWHSCPEHATWPASNSDWWRAKLARNKERDLDVNAALSAAGWAVIRVWEHENAIDAADRVQAAVQKRGP